jgi:hypothetical protein
MRVYMRYHKCLNSQQITNQLFYTFKPTRDNIIFHKLFKSRIINNLTTKYKENDKIVYGVANYNGINKILLAPYGHQLEFVELLKSNSYVPFLDTSLYFSNELVDPKAILHYMTYFPDNDYHQFYYYWNKEFNTSYMDPRLKHYDADYFATSLTFNGKWNVIKRNSYAIRVPLEACSTMIKKEFNLNLHNINNINISYRKSLDNKDNNDSMTICYLLHNI